MHTLSVTTSGAPDEEQFVVRWAWRASNASMPSKGGTVAVALNKRYTEDRDILAELGALHHLLCVQQVHGQNRLGTGLTVEVSRGAIKKAVARGALKTTDSGRTDKTHVARFAHFLATRFFGARVQVGRRPPGEPATALHVAITLDAPPLARIDSAVGPVVISRHALNRFVERFAAADMIKAGAELVDVPDQKWTQAWRNLQTFLPKAVPATGMLEREKQRIARKYGPGTIVLFHADSQLIFIIVRETYGLVMATVLRRNPRYDRMVPPLPTWRNWQAAHSAL